MSTLRVNSGTIIASPTWEPTGLLQDQVLALSGLFYSPVAFGTPYRFSLPAGRNGPSLRAVRTASLTLARSRRSSGGRANHRVMDRSIDRQHAIDRLFRPLPPEIKRVLVIVHHISRFSLRRPQCGSLREGLNSRTWWPRFNARMTPIRANIVGPPDVATRIKASIA